MSDGKSDTTLPPFDIRPGERYTDAEGRTWELTDHGQWKEVNVPYELRYRPFVQHPNCVLVRLISSPHVAQGQAP